MISNLTGQVIDINSRTVVLDVAGVGYEVHCTVEALQRLDLGAPASLVIYTEVRDDAIKLFGFADKLEKQTFLLLMRVKGVGARTAGEIVSNVNKRELLKLIAAGELATLQAIKGIGKKTAERIIVELKDKVGSYVLENQSERLGVEQLKSEPIQDALQAMTTLGFSKHEAETALKKVQNEARLDSLEAGELVREALRHV